MRFIDFCNRQRATVRASLERFKLEDTGKGYVKVPCTKEESIENALEAFDAVVSEAEKLRVSSLAFERIMDRHGVRLGSTYTLAEYLATIEEIKREEGTGVFPVTVVK